MKVEAEIDLYASMLQQILKSALQKTTAKKILSVIHSSC